MSSDSIERLISELTRLPGIGRKTAQRITFYLMKVDRGRTAVLAQAILDVKEKVRFCSICFNLTEEDPCTICSDQRRDHTLICVVEEASDIQAFERTRAYSGVYHVLGGALSPLDGIYPDDLRIKELLARVDEARVREIVLATNPDVNGEATSLHLSKLLSPRTKVTRIARGLPMGADLDLADEVTLARALEGRSNV